jgi:hypothetical protein
MELTLMDLVERRKYIMNMNSAIKSVYLELGKNGDLPKLCNVLQPSADHAY